MTRPVPSPSALKYLASCLHHQQTPKKPVVFRALTHSTRCSSHPARRRNYTTATARKQSDYVFRPMHQQQQPGPAPPQSSRPKAGKDALEKEYILDEDINAHQVQLKDSQTGTLNPPQTLRSLLYTLNRDKNVIRQLAERPNMPTVVEITTREVLQERLKQKEAQVADQNKQKRDTKPKQVELNWAISAHDLELKMKQLRQFVEKGKRVEVLLAAKKRQRKASLEEAEGVMNEIRKTVKEIEGCKELKPMEGRIGGQVLMIFGKR